MLPQSKTQLMHQKHRRTHDTHTQERERERERGRGGNVFVHRSIATEKICSGLEKHVSVATFSSTSLANRYTHTAHTHYKERERQRESEGGRATFSSTKALHRKNVVQALKNMFPLQRFRPPLSHTGTHTPHGEEGGWGWGGGRDCSDVPRIFSPSTGVQSIAPRDGIFHSGEPLPPM